MEPIQIALTVCLFSLSAILLVSGVWLLFLIKDLRLVLKKTASILDDTHLITSSVAKPVSSASDFIMGFKNGIKVFNKFFDKEDNQS